MTDDQAYLVRGEDGEEYGPVALAELREWVGENRVGLGTDVKLAAPGAAWRPWHFYPELVALLAEMRVTGLPGGSALGLPVLAPMGRRIAAFVLDLIMSLVPVAILSCMLCWLLPVDVIAHSLLYSQAYWQGQPLPPAPVLPAWFQLGAAVIVRGIPVVYYAGFHAAHGRTPAKSIFRLKVTDAQGRKPTFFKALLRSFVFVISVYFLCGIPLLYAFFNPQRRAPHDLAADTYVVER